MVEMLSAVVSGVTSLDKATDGMVAGLLTIWATTKIGLALLGKLASVFVVATTEMNMAAVAAKRWAAVKFMGMVGLGVAVLAIRDLTNNQRELIDTSENLVEKQRKTAQVAKEQADQLMNLAKKTELSNDEMNRAEGLIASITKEYGDMGWAVDRTAKKITGATAAMEKFNRRIVDIDIERMKARQRKLNANYDRVKKDLEDREEALGLAGESVKYQVTPGTEAGRRLKEWILGGKTRAEMKKELEELADEWWGLHDELEKIELRRTGEALDDEINDINDAAEASKELVNMRLDAERELRDFRIDQIEDAVERERAMVEARYKDEEDAIRRLIRARGGLVKLLETPKDLLEIMRMMQVVTTRRVEALAPIAADERMRAEVKKAAGIIGPMVAGAALAGGAFGPPMKVDKELARAQHVGLVQFHKAMQRALVDSEAKVEREQLKEQKGINKRLGEANNHLAEIAKKEGGVFAWG